MDKSTVKIMLEAGRDHYTVSGWTPAAIANLCSESLRIIEDLEEKLNNAQQIRLG